MTPFKKGRDLFRVDTHAPHAGIHHNVHRDSFTGLFRLLCQCIDHLERTHGGLAPAGDNRLAVLGERCREQQHVGLNTRRGKRSSFANVGNTERVVAETDQVPCNDRHPVAIAIRLDGRPHWPLAGQLLENAQIVCQAVEMDERPGQVTRVRLHASNTLLHENTCFQMTFLHIP
jgi:hypothetical protein